MEPFMGGPRRAVLRRCALFVRTLEKGAHLRRNRRGFPRCALSKTSAHLRIGCAPSKQGVALGYPLAGAVPLARKLAQPLAAAVRSACRKFVSFMRSIAT